MVRGIFRFGEGVVDVVEVVVPSRFEVVEVVDVVELVVLGASGLRTLAYRASGSTGFTTSGSGTGLHGRARRRRTQKGNDGELDVGFTYTETLTGFNGGQKRRT